MDAETEVAPTFRSASETGVEPAGTPSPASGNPAGGALSFEPAAETGESVERDPAAELAAAAPQTKAIEEPELTLADLSQEIRRVGRELFKTNRAAERNQELFESTLEELRQLRAAVIQANAQSSDPVFLAKAALCRELLAVTDALEASRSAADEVL